LLIAKPTADTQALDTPPGTGYISCAHSVMAARQRGANLGQFL
jgi:hypothetical protein